MRFTLGLAMCYAVALYCAVRTSADGSGSSSLTLRVGPESRLMPSHASLRFRIANGGAMIASQNLPVVAWIRTLPNQSIRLTMTAADGNLPASALRWSGMRTAGTGGGETAVCTSGTFEAGSTAEVAGKWNRSGTLTCAVMFSLANPDTLAPGEYFTDVQFNLRAE